MATTQEMIDSIDTQLEALIANPQVDYTIGKKKVSASQKTKQLLEIRKALIEEADADIKIVRFDYDVNQFGGDNTQFAP